MLQRILYNVYSSLKKIFQKVKDIMGEYSKKLHIRKNGTVEDITLYTNSDVSNNTIKVRDGGTICYVPIGSTDDSNASSLRVRKNGTTYAAMLKIGYSNSADIQLRRGGTEYDINIPSNVKKIRFTIHDYEPKRIYECSVNNPNSAGVKKVKRGDSTGTLYDAYFYVNKKCVETASFNTVNDIYCLIEW